jgi:hypothetical protein
MRNGEILNSSLGDMPCSEVSRIELCAKHAAAPDLLAALEWCLEWIDDNRDADDTGEGQQALAVIGNARAAIAKAKGD